jgi:hypothetical protein
MTTKNDLLAHVQAFKDTQVRVEEQAFLDFCHNTVKRATHSAKVGEREYVATVQFVCTVSKEHMKSKLEELFHGCDVEVCVRHIGAEELIDRVIIRW